MKLALVGLGWDVNQFETGGSYDLDASAFLLGANDKLITDSDFVFYNNLNARNGAVVHKAGVITEFDPALMMAVMDNITVFKDGRLQIRFYDRTEYEVETE